VSVRLSRILCAVHGSKHLMHIQQHACLLMEPVISLQAFNCTTQPSEDTEGLEMVEMVYWVSRQRLTSPACVC
jgi:hypothetical protein